MPMELFIMVWYGIYAEEVEPNLLALGVFLSAAINIYVDINAMGKEATL